MAEFAAGCYEITAYESAEWDFNGWDGDTAELPPSPEARHQAQGGLPFGLTEPRRPPGWNIQHVPRGSSYFPVTEQSAHASIMALYVVVRIG